MEKLHVREKVGYAFGDFSSCLIWQSISIYLLFYFTNVAGVEQGAAIAIITLNDMPAGYTTEHSIEITDLDLNRELTVCISPVSSTGYRGETKCTTMASMTDVLGGTDESLMITLPKAPNTGVGV